MHVLPPRPQAFQPFNPLLGETYEHVDAKRRLRFVAEQVSHHPPMAASHAESEHWTLAQEFAVDTRFRGKMKLTPHGQVRLRLHAHGEDYVWGKVATTIEDIMSGKKWADHHGTMCITNLATKGHATVKFTESSMFKKDKRRDVHAVSPRPPHPHSLDCPARDALCTCPPRPARGWGTRVWRAVRCPVLPRPTHTCPPWRPE